MRCAQCGNERSRMFEVIGNEGHVCPECLSMRIKRDEWSICAECGRVIFLDSMWDGYNSLWARHEFQVPREQDCVPICPECLEIGLASGEFKLCDDQGCGHGLYERTRKD